LPGGKHCLEVSAMGRDLSPDDTPAVLKFTINIDPAKQIAGYVTDLSSADIAVRERAVAGLARQPERAREALEMARPNADETTQWWIDAALSEIENARRLSTKGMSVSRSSLLTH
jgi:hypothetical protein